MAKKDASRPRDQREGTQDPVAVDPEQRDRLYDDTLEQLGEDESIAHWLRRGHSLDDGLRERWQDENRLLHIIDDLTKDALERYTLTLPAAELEAHVRHRMTSLKLIVADREGIWPDRTSDSVYTDLELLLAYQAILDHLAHEEVAA